MKKDDRFSDGILCGIVISLLIVVFVSGIYGLFTQNVSVNRDAMDQVCKTITNDENTVFDIETDGIIYCTKIGDKVYDHGKIVLK